ncbi:MAG: ABC transporter ATP-binding protein [Chloroflexota bacterium]|nr:ABC transporter ATP-binding protein [Chloroflexota bacterium]
MTANLRRNEKPQLALHDVSASYVERGEILLALTGISFEIADGEFVALIGPSGSGKSTLLDIVSGLFPETGGSVQIAGKALSLDARLGQSAYMRQRDLLLPWRTALGNAALALEVHGLPKREAMANAAQRFPAFGLAGFEHAYPGQLSGGMRQRVAFLRTMLADRPLLLLDEPFGALDALNRVAMQAWLLDLWEAERRSVLLVTHDIDEAIFLADRVIVLSSRPGTITHTETISLVRPRHRSVLASDAFFAHRARIAGSLGLLDEPAAVAGVGR